MSEYKYRLVEDCLLIKQLDLLANEIHRLGGSPFHNRDFEPFVVSHEPIEFPHIDSDVEFNYEILLEHICDESIILDGEEYIRSSILGWNMSNSDDGAKTIRHDWYSVDEKEDS